MHESLNWINLFIATLGISAACYLFFAGKENPYLSKLLALILFAMSVRNFTQGLVNIHVIDFSVLPLYLFVGFQFIVPASVFLYQRALINDELQWKNKYIWHFLPGFIVFIITFFSFFVYQQKPPSDSTPFAYDQMVQELNLVIKTKYLYYCWMIVALPYLILIYKVFVDAFSQGNFIGKHGKEVGIWVLIQMIPFTLFYFFLGKEVFSASMNNKPISTNTYHLVMKNMYLLTMVTYVWMKPQLLLGLPKWKKQDIPISNTFSNKLEIAGWKNPALDEEQIIQNNNLTLIIETVQKYACTSSDFNKEDFSIEDLSKHTKLPIHHLKFIFKYYQDYGFHGYKNFIRMVKVITLIYNNKHLSHTIESLGESAGFGSNSTMLRTFKKHIGLSPVEIIQQIHTVDVINQTNNSKLSNICRLIPTA